MPSARQEMATREPAPCADGWRRWTANGAVVTAVALGLRQPLHEPEEVRRVVVGAPAEPLRPPQPLELHFDPAGPAHTWVVVRPWLFEAGP